MPVADNSEVVLFDLLIVCHFLTCLSVDIPVYLEIKFVTRCMTSIIY